MGNVYPATGDQNYHFAASAARDDDDEGVDSEMSVALASLLEENVRLRGLIVQLSEIVLKNVAGRK